MADIKALRSEAKELGLRWSEVQATYKQLRELGREERSRDWDIRKHVWNQYAYSEANRAWWRCGMQHTFPHAFAEGDRTNIPRFDEVAQEVAQLWPEFGRDGDPAEALFEYLQMDWERVPAAEETYRQAMELLVEDGGPVEFVAPEDDSF